MAQYSIKDLENFTGVKAHTIRIWEKRYNLVEPKRTCTNIRYYDDDDLKKLLNVSILNRHGFKISNIVNFTNEALNEKILNLAQTQNDVESQIESLVVAMIDMDEAKFEKVFNTAVINLGFEEAILKIMYPFFEKIGVLWQIGTINPAQEHFISNLLRQKLIVAIDGIVENFKSQAKSFLLYLPEGEYHELGLIYYHYIIRKHQHKVIYLGETVPFDGLVEISKTKKIDYIVTSMVKTIADNAALEYFTRLSEQFKDSGIFLTGLRAKDLNIKLPENITLINNVYQFKEEIEKFS
jgi:DNA-binding transcriptional MerR regulator